MMFCDAVKCRGCNKTMRECWCSPVPCPFCDSVFGFIQDWNIHLQENHKEKLEGYDK